MLNLSETSLRECWVGSFWFNDTQIWTILCWFKVQELFKICGQGGLSQNIALKMVANITSKNNRTFLKSWSELLLNRLKPTKLLYQCILTFWIISYVQECFCVNSVCTYILFYVENRKKLHCNILRESLIQVARILASNCTNLSTFLLVNLNKR